MLEFLSFVAIHCFCLRVFSTFLCSKLGKTPFNTTQDAPNTLKHGPNSLHRCIRSLRPQVTKRVRKTIVKKKKKPPAFEGKERCRTPCTIFFKKGPKKGRCKKCLRKRLNAWGGHGERSRLQLLLR